tara:strand:- start:485 stop:652 length:168 start_codon:yes stop_codon:yes gene_type:complete
MIIDPFLNNPKTRYYQQNNMNQWTNMPAISDELYNELLREFEQDSRSYSSPILST